MKGCYFTTGWSVDWFGFPFYTAGLLPKPHGVAREAAAA